MTKRHAHPLEPDPQWERVANIVQPLTDALAADDRLVAEVDQLRAYVRDTLDELGISVRHEPSVYIVLSTVGLVVEMAKNSVRNGITDQAFLHSIAELARTVSLALLEYLPEEARPA